MRTPSAFVVLIVVATAVVTAAQSQEGFRFKSGVEFVNVTATVTDGDGRFVSGLRQEDFTVYEDGQIQDVSHFSSDRVPVSLGIALDSSGSMSPDKLSAARAAIDRLIFKLLDQEDELFFLEFATRAEVTQGWTTDRQLISRAIKRVNAVGGTALYDAVAEALPTTEQGRNRKKALLVISDGNDTNSSIRVNELRQRIRESEVLVYALGVDSTSRESPRVQPPVQFPPPDFPFPIPGRRPRYPPIGGGGGTTSWPRSPGERVNADALRQITDDTGGRTEIVRGFEGLDDATARIADELSKQYFLGYPAANEKKDGKWHAIRVEVTHPDYIVRARRGYVATP
jgi:Ca-activated chloride channel family protein